MDYQVNTCNDMLAIKWQPFTLNPGRVPTKLASLSVAAGGGALSVYLGEFSERIFAHSQVRPLKWSIVKVKTLQTEHCIANGTKTLKFSTFTSYQVPDQL